MAVFSGFCSGSGSVTGAAGTSGSFTGGAGWGSGAGGACSSTTGAGASSFLIGFSFSFVLLKVFYFFIQFQ